MKMPRRHRQRTSDDEGCRTGGRPSREARARYDDAVAKATLRRMFPPG
jgi:hypothetical protein